MGMYRSMIAESVWLGSVFAMDDAFTSVLVIEQIDGVTGEGKTLDESGVDSEEECSLVV